jgi:hypothetical protein
MLTSRPTTVIIASAAAIGIAADQLVRTPADWGINVPLAASLLAVLGAAMPSRDGRTPPHWPWLASVCFASMWALRDAQPLLAVDLLAALALASLPLLQQAGIKLRAVPLIDLCFSPLRAAWTASFGTLDFLQTARAEHIASAPARSRAGALGVGALIAMPLVLVFGSLFAAADPVFGTVVSTLLGDNLRTIGSHVAIAGGFAWAAAGYLWFLTKPEHAATSRRVQVVGHLQVLTPLAAVAVLFGLFVGVQATSLFGGAAFVQTSTGLTFAEYARGGFFQLVFASMLVLPLIYVAPMAAGPLDHKATVQLRGLLGAQLGLTGLVLASALWRMMLYVRMYGLTVDRVNGTAIMLWIAGTLGVFAATVVRGRPQAAAFGSLVAAVATLAVLNLANPDALIARYDLSHQNGRQTDFAHLARLGGDAVPILAARIDGVPPTERCRVVATLRKRFLPNAPDWRSWNLARARARDAATGLVAQRCPSTAPGPPASPAP